MNQPLTEQMLSLIGKKRWNVLLKLIKKNGYRKIVEVGVAQGWTSKHILEHTEDVLRTYIGVDPYLLPERKDQLREAQSVYKHQAKARLMVMTSEKASKKLTSQRFDLIFLDADHTYNNIKEDIKLWLPKVRRGGILCGHDYNMNTFPGVVMAVNAAFGHNNIELYPDDVWVYYKKRR